ncbi:MAG: 3-deoxy-D-manno-octulosonic acid transferase, partial [Candidatus Omnitrophota bacterium]
FSSVTHTGNRVARTIATADEAVFYLPFDMSFVTTRVTRAVKPDMFLSLETELWPNLISSLHKSGAKIVLVNGRISNRSYSRYKNAKIFISPVLDKFSLILTQSDRDAVRFLSLGAAKEKVSVTGNLKFDLPLLGIENKRQEIRSKLDVKDDEILFMAGSTHRGEEGIIIDCFAGLKKEYPGLRLFIAPRHVERAAEVESLLSGKGFEPEKVSSVSSPSARAVFLLDTVGELRAMYSAADIVFVGGSLIKKGGQNPIEPAILGRPVIFGKFTFNFHDVVRLFLKNEAAIQVDNKEELYSAVRFLLDNPKERKKLGINARDTISKNTGSSQRTIEGILSLS